MIRLMVALGAGLGVWVVTTASRRIRIGDRVETFFRRPETADIDVGVYPHLLGAGIDWTGAEFRTRRAFAGAAGAAAGALLAQGDLFITGPNRSVPALMLLGGAAGFLVFSMWLSSRRQQRKRQLLIELPTAVDMAALQLLAGASVESAVRSLTADTGVVAYEMRHALSAAEAGSPLSETLRGLGDHSSHPDAARFYDLLAEAHITGGRVGDGLEILARDYRATNERELVTEGGRRALVAYGPILALMVPVTLLFLMYPTIAGLQSLTGG